MKANYKNFKISTGNGDYKRPIWDTKPHKHYIITVVNTETKARTNFSFYASLAQPDFKSEYDVLNAFYCFVSDAVAGIDTFENFCSDFGYDTDSIKALKTYRACERALKKFTHVSNMSAYSDTIYDFANELQEIAG